jgi:hypothetical protein
MLGSTTVVVSNPDGQSATLAGGFTYIPNLSLTSAFPSVPTAGQTSALHYGPSNLAM